MILMPEVAPLKYQKFMIGFIGIVLSVSGVLGPLLGGVLTEYATWRWVFWIKFVSFSSRELRTPTNDDTTAALSAEFRLSLSTLLGRIRSNSRLSCLEGGRMWTIWGPFFCKPSGPDIPVDHVL